MANGLDVPDSRLFPSLLTANDHAMFGDFLSVRDHRWLREARLFLVAVH
jgi:hypothetical protein